MARRRGLLPFAAGVVAAVSSLSACTGGPGAPPVAACLTASPPASASRPNIVFVLTDDLSSDLVRYMPHVVALERRGVAFSNYTVTDSLCCPSRTSILTGRFPHDTHVFSNGGPFGGFHQVHKRGEEAVTFATALHAAGYRTALMGKYLNGYHPARKLGGAQPYVPPGWSEWDVAGKGYAEFHYTLNQNHRVVHYGGDDSDYLTDVLGQRAVRFIEACPQRHAPFLLEVATFAPHKPYTPAPRDRHVFKHLIVPRDPSFNRLPQRAPPWLAGRPVLAPAEVAHLDYVFREQVRADRAVDRVIGTIEDALRRSGDAGDTDIFFSSDNGYHLGQHALPPGKMTAFDTDIKVPLVAAGVGIAHDRVVSAVAENVDLAPTFEALGGVTPPPEIDGRSLLPLLRGGRAPHWRTAALIEHHHVNILTAGPDDENLARVDPPSYDALRTATYVYVQYADGSREFYDLVRDPDETDNLAPVLPVRTLRALHRSLRALTTCHGTAACWAAGSPPPLPG